MANLIYALNYTFAKDVMPNFIQPSGFVLLRAFSGVILFFITYKFFIKEKIYKKDLFRFSIAGLFGVSINQLLFFNGLNLSTPINAAIIMTTTPVLVLIMSYIILKEKLTLRKVCGIFLGIIGAVFLILIRGDLSINYNTQLGNFFVFLNASSYALYLVIVKPLMNKYHPVTVMFLVFSFGLVYIFPFGYKELMMVCWKSITVDIYFSILFVLIFTTFLAYLFNSLALKRVNPSIVGIYIYLQPVLGTIFAVYMQRDILTINKLLASMIIFIGVYLVSLPSLKINDKLS